MYYNNHRVEKEKLVFLGLTTIILGTMGIAMIIPLPLAGAQEFIPTPKCPNSDKGVLEDPIGCAPFLPVTKCPNSDKGVLEDPIGCAPLKPNGN